MSIAANGARVIFMYLKGNAVLAYGKVLLWRAEHPQAAELIDALIKTILIKLTADFASEVLVKAIKNVRAR